MNSSDQLHHFHLDSVLSRDGAVTLYRATDSRSGRTILLKIPHPGMEADSVFADRLEREREIGTKLNHPGLLKVLTDDGQHPAYLAMEWFDGQPLRQLLNQNKKLPPERATRIASGVCDTLYYIHSHGIVHRDLQPENILVDANDSTKLTNFHVAAKEGAPRLTFTNLSQLLGSSPYISPEELKGSRGDARGDIYGLGIILYEMLTGKLPFPGPDLFDRLTVNPIPPRDIEPSISPQLQEVIYRAIEREHKSRYPNAHDMAFDLAHLDQVRLTHRVLLPARQKASESSLKTPCIYAAIALIPIIIFGLLLYFARH